MTSQKDLIFEYYKSRPDKSIPHAEAVDWATREYTERTGKKLRDPDRAIRKLHQEGLLVKEGKGIYKYSPSHASQRKLEDFSATQKKQILKRDEYKCVVCGQGEKEGYEIHVDHIKPKDRGGRATVENGQTLCATHNFRKKNYSQTESGKQMFIQLREQAKAVGDDNIVTFAEAILKTYKKYDINGHIDWAED